MLETTHQISSYVGVFSEAILFVVSLVYCPQKFNPNYLRTFPIFCLVELVADLIMLLYKYKEIPVLEGVTYNLLGIIELTYFYYFFCQFYQPQFIKNIMRILIVLFYVQFLSHVLLRGIRFAQPADVVIESMILIIFCLFFFRNLLYNKFVNDLSKYPAFWIVMALLLNSAIAVPFYLCQGYFIIKGMTQIASEISTINSFSIVVTNILYIMGCTCRINT